MAFVAQSVEDKVNVSILWGFMSVLIQACYLFGTCINCSTGLISLKLSITEQEAIPRVARMIKSIGHKIELFNAHCDGITRVEKAEEAALDVLIYLAIFFTESITFFHDNTGPSCECHF